MLDNYTITLPYLTITVKGNGSPHESSTLATALPYSVVDYQGTADGQSRSSMEVIAGLSVNTRTTLGAHPSQPVYQFGDHHPHWQHLKMDFRNLSEWVTLAGEIKSWPVALPHERDSDEYLWGLDAFWMAFTAAHPVFPLGVWPSWDHRIRMTGAFHKEFFKSRFDGSVSGGFMPTCETRTGDEDAHEDSDEEVEAIVEEVGLDQKLLARWRDLNFHLLLIR